jgi:hypothetical protein
MIVYVLMYCMCATAIIGTAFRWAAIGDATDGRLLVVARVVEGNGKTPCNPGQPKGFGACARSVASLIRELRYDHTVDQIVTMPVGEYAALHNAVGAWCVYCSVLCRPVGEYAALHNAVGAWRVYCSVLCHGMYRYR